MEQKNQTVLKLAQTAILATLCYVTFTYLQIKIPMPGGDATSIHIGIASVAGLGFNVIADPIAGYFYKQYILGQPQQMAEVLAKWSTATTFVNAVVSTVLVAFLYNAVRPALLRSGLLVKPGKAA